jgi:hypothetical protein
MTQNKTFFKDIDQSTSVKIEDDDEILDVAHHPHDHIGVGYKLKPTLKVCIYKRIYTN